MVDHFEESVRMSTYLLAFIVCDYGYKSEKTSRGIEVSKSDCLVALIAYQNFKG